MQLIYFRMAPSYLADTVTSTAANSNDHTFRLSAVFVTIYTIYLRKFEQRAFLCKLHQLPGTALTPSFHHSSDTAIVERHLKLYSSSMSSNNFYIVCIHPFLL